MSLWKKPCQRAIVKKHKQTTPMTKFFLSVSQSDFFASQQARVKNLHQARSALMPRQEEENRSD